MIINHNLGVINANRNMNTELSTQKLLNGTSGTVSIASTTSGSGGVYTITNATLAAGKVTIDGRTLTISGSTPTLCATDLQMKINADATLDARYTTSENLTSGESKISDIDMAKKMSTISKKNILDEAAKAMHAQANQQPQQVLTLLR